MPLVRCSAKREAAGKPHGGDSPSAGAKLGRVWSHHAGESAAPLISGAEARLRSPSSISRAKCNSYLFQHTFFFLPHHRMAVCVHPSRLSLAAPCPCRSPVRASDLPHVHFAARRAPTLAARRGQPARVTTHLQCARAASLAEMHVCTSIGAEYVQCSLCMMNWCCGDGLCWLPIVGEACLGLSRPKN